MGQINRPLIGSLLVMTIDARKTLLPTKLPGVILLGGSYGSLAAARSFGRQGIPVAFFSTQHTAAQYSRYIQHHVAWQGPDQSNALEFFLEKSLKLGLANWLLLPSSDHEVQFVTQNYDALAAHFALVTMPWAALEQLNDKAQLCSLAERLGIDFPKVYWDGDAHTTSAEDIRYPVVLKPSSTEKINPLTKAKAWRADSIAEFEPKFTAATQYMGEHGFVVQELIPGDGSAQFSYAGLWDHGIELCGLTARRSRQFPAEFGTSPFVETVELPEVRAQARRLLEAVHYHGLVEVEFKLDQRDNSLKLLDVNTRIWAWIGLGEAAGFDFPTLAAQLAKSETPETHTAKYGPSWRHPVPNTLSLLQSLVRSGRLGYAGRRSIFARSVSSIFAADDLKPALAEVPVHLLRKIKRLLPR